MESLSGLCKVGSSLPCAEGRTHRAQCEGLRARLSGKQTSGQDAGAVFDYSRKHRFRAIHDGGECSEGPRAPPAVIRLHAGASTKGVTALLLRDVSMDRTPRTCCCSMSSVARTRWPHLLRGCLSGGPDPGGEHTPQLRSSGGYFSRCYQLAGWCLDRPLGLRVPVWTWRTLLDGLLLFSALTALPKL